MRVLEKNEMLSHRNFVSVIKISVKETLFGFFFFFWVEEREKSSNSETTVLRKINKGKYAFRVFYGVPECQKKGEK